MFEWISYFIVGGVALGWVVARRMNDRALWSLLLVAVLLRMVGGIVRLEVIDQFYGGVGDSKMYFGTGVLYAERIRDFDFGFIADDIEASGRYWGTPFVRIVTGFVCAVVGPSMLACFLVFGFFSFFGLYLSVKAFDSAFEGDGTSAYAKWVWLWPSLWFWPVSVGKDALMILAVGMVTFGYVGLRGRVQWLLVGLGILLAGSVRPHVAGVLATTVLLAEWLSPGALFKGSRAANGVLAAILTLVTIFAGLTQLGLGDSDLEGIQEHFEFRSEKTVAGGSQIEITTGLSAVPMALINVLMRPFPWGAHNILMLISSLEIWGFWGLMFFRRRELKQVLRVWRHNRLIRFAVPGILLLSFLYGLAFANLGIIARQRVVILPPLFIFLGATSAIRARKRAERKAAAAAEPKVRVLGRPAPPVVTA